MKLNPTKKTTKVSIAIVCSRFNEDITAVMKDEALTTAKKMGAAVIFAVSVSGAFEIPFATQKLLRKKNIDGVAAIGAVIKGSTGHDEIIMQSVVPQLLEISLAFKKPVSLGIIGPNATWKQANTRKKTYARNSIVTLVEMILLNRKL